MCSFTGIGPTVVSRKAKQRVCLLPVACLVTEQIEIIFQFRDCNIYVLTLPIDVCAHPPPWRGLLSETNNIVYSLFHPQRSGFKTLCSFKCSFP